MRFAALLFGVMLSALTILGGCGKKAEEKAKEAPAPTMAVQEMVTTAPEAEITEPEAEITEPAEEEVAISESGSYSSKEEVALYIATFGHLPDNYLTKNKAQDLGWDNSKGNLWEVAPGMSIGGNKFGNYEGLLPEKSGRTYYECDIDYDGGYRNAKRIIFSNDGLIYYTEDHYESFELLYGEP